MTTKEEEVETEGEEKSKEEKVQAESKQKKDDEEKSLKKRNGKVYGQPTEGSMQEVKRALLQVGHFVLI